VPGWQHPNGGRFYSSSAHLCYDCVVECYKNLAKQMLEQIKLLKFDQIKNVDEIKELAEIRHERKIYLAKVKVIKDKIKKVKTIEKNNGLDVAGYIL